MPASSSTSSSVRSSPRPTHWTAAKRVSSGPRAARDRNVQRRFSALLLSAPSPKASAEAGWYGVPAAVSSAYAHQLRSVLLAPTAAKRSPWPASPITSMRRSSSIGRTRGSLGQADDFAVSAVGSRAMDSPRAVQLPQGTVEYREAGSGPPVVLLHGLLVDGTLWRDVVARLAPGFRVLVPELPFGCHRLPLAPGQPLAPPDVAR